MNTITLITASVKTRPAKNKGTDRNARLPREIPRFFQRRTDGSDEAEEPAAATDPYEVLEETEVGAATEEAGAFTSVLANAPGT